MITRHHSSSSNKKQVKSEEEIYQYKVEALEFASRINSDRQILSYMADINAYLYMGMRDRNVMKKAEKDYMTEKSYFAVNSDGLNNFLQTEGEIATGFVALEWQSEYLKKYWPSTFHKTDTIAGRRKVLLELGLIKFELNKRPKGAYWGSLNGMPGQGVATPPVVEMYIVKMVIFYQALEQTRRERHYKKYENKGKWAIANNQPFDMLPEPWMPDHGGQFVACLFSAIFDYGFELGCDLENSQCVEYEVRINPMKVEQKPVILRWKYKPRNYLAIALWRKMVTKFGFVFDAAETVTQRLIEEINYISGNFSKPHQQPGSIWEIPY